MITDNFASEYVDELGSVGSLSTLLPSRQTAGTSSVTLSSIQLKNGGTKTTSTSTLTESRHKAAICKSGWTRSPSTKLDLLPSLTLTHTTSSSLTPRLLKTSARSDEGRSLERRLSVLTAGRSWPLKNKNNATLPFNGKLASRKSPHALHQTTCKYIKTISQPTCTETNSTNVHPNFFIQSVWSSGM